MELLEKQNWRYAAKAMNGKKWNKIIALDKLFKSNDQLKTNTILQMRDAGIEFKTI